MPSPWIIQMLRDEDEKERRELQARLAPGALDDLGIIERSAERRAIRARLIELGDIVPPGRCTVCNDSILTIEDRGTVCRQCRLQA